VHDPLQVRLLERPAHLDQDRDRPIGRHRPFFSDHLVQVSPFQVLHHDVERPVLELPVEQHLHGIRVRQVAHRPRLAAKARHQILAVNELLMEDFDRDHPIHVGLRGLVDGAHPSRPDLLQDLELAT
jgi:hypothetical protein